MRGTVVRIVKTPPLLSCAVARTRARRGSSTRLNGLSNPALDPVSEDSLESLTHPILGLPGLGIAPGYRNKSHSSWEIH